MWTHFVVRMDRISDHRISSLRAQGGKYIFILPDIWQNIRLDTNNRPDIGYKKVRISGSSVAHCRENYSNMHDFFHRFIINPETHGYLIRQFSNQFCAPILYTSYIFKYSLSQKLGLSDLKKYLEKIKKKHYKITENKVRIP